MQQRAGTVRSHEPIDVAFCGSVQRDQQFQFLDAVRFADGCIKFPAPIGLGIIRLLHRHFTEVADRLGYGIGQGLR